MSHEGSVSQWIHGLKSGDDDAAQRVWERYFDRLTRVARDRLRAVHREGAAQDEEDVALSALNSVCLGALRGRFPNLENRDDLWKLLVLVASRKALNQARDQRRQKRGGGRVWNEADFAAARPEGDQFLAQVVSREPTPEFAATFADEVRKRLDELPDETLRRVALLRLEGYGNDEIAERLGCTVRTVIRKVEVIRKHWLADEPDETDPG